MLGTVITLAADALTTLFVILFCKNGSTKVVSVKLLSGVTVEFTKKEFLNFTKDHVVVRRKGQYYEIEE